MTIKQTPVTSSIIRSVGHDAKTSTLAVTHHDGGVYHYEGVSASKYAKLLKADSVGSFMHEHVRGIHAHKRQN